MTPIPLTRRDVLAHQATVPWPNLSQVEQDLVLCRAMAALFDDKFLRTQIAMRGGTLLHKVHLAPAARYSEDIDLVVVGSRPEGHIVKAISRVLRPLLGMEVSSLWDEIRLAIRNTVKPSRVLRLTFAVPSVSEPGRSLQIVVEANATERTPYRPVVTLPFDFTLQGSVVRTKIRGFDIHEMLGTKMRALFQRRRGRDLFDLYWALQDPNLRVSPALVIECLQHYLRQEGGLAPRREFVSLLDAHLADRGFCTDMNQLLRVGLSYDPQKAGSLVKAQLLSLLPA